MSFTGISRFRMLVQFLLSCLVLLSMGCRVYGIDALKAFGWQFSPMSYASALGLMLSIFVLFVLGKSPRIDVHRKLITIAAFVLGLLGLAPLLLHMAGDLLLGRFNFEGHIAVVTFLYQPLTGGLYLLAAAATFFSLDSSKTKNTVAQLSTLLLFLTTLMILLQWMGYSANDQEIFAGLEAVFIPALGLLFFSIALFFSNPAIAISANLLNESIEEVAQRYILPTVILIPPSAYLIISILENFGYIQHPDVAILTVILIILMLGGGMLLLRKFIDNVETQFELIANAAPVLMWMAIPDGLTNYYNAQWLEFTGRGLADEINTKLEQCIHPDDINIARTNYTKAFVSHKPFTQEYRLLRHDGQYRWVLENACPYWGVDGAFKGFIGSCTDITDHKQAFEKLQLVSHVFENSEQGIVVTDADKFIIMTNPAFTELTGYSRQEAIARELGFFQADDLLDEHVFREMRDALRQKNCWQGEVWKRRNNGELFLIELSINVVRDSQGKVVNYMGVFSDITQRKFNEEYYQHLAHFDPLTDLPNRVLLSDRIEQVLLRAERHEHKVALMFLDLDKFKAVNDEMGHHIGDMLLKEVAKRIMDCVRQEDTVSRLGGDEFVVLLPTISGRRGVAAIAEKILAVLSMPYRLEQYCFSNNVSIGIAIYPEDGRRMKVLLKHADQAMYQIKQNGNSMYVFYQDKSAANNDRALQGMSE